MQAQEVGVVLARVVHVRWTGIAAVTVRCKGHRQAEVEAGTVVAPLAVGDEDFSEPNIDMGTTPGVTKSGRLACRLQMDPGSAHDGVGRNADGFGELRMEGDAVM